MEPLITLCSREACLQIRQTTIDGTWSQCWLLQNNKDPRFLGADSLKIILSRLLDGLDNNSRQSEGKLGDYEAYWVLSLAEAHHALYIAKDGTERILLWQDADRGISVVCEMRLSQNECSEWISKLRALISAN